MPVAGLGHGAGDDRAERRRACRRAPGDRTGGPLAARRGGRRCAATGRLRGPAWRPAAGRSSSRTSTTPTSTTRPRSCSRWSVSAARCRWRGSTAARSRALDWVEGMQSSDGGWGAFDADNTRALVRELPFLRLRRGDRRAERRRDRAHDRDARRRRPRGQSRGAAPGCAGCSSTRRPTARGSGAGAINHVYGTGAAVPGLIAAGEDPASASIRRAVRWLEEHQNDDGGWGEDARSYDDPHWIGRGPSTASQTAWALLALHAAGERSEALARGVAWLDVDPAPRRRLGRAAVHGHRLPLRLLHQLPPLQDQLPAHGPRPLPGGPGRPRTGGRGRRTGREPGVTLLAEQPFAAPSAEAVMARAETENFPVASRLLPRAQREHLLAVYGFARLVDELGDSLAGPTRQPLGGTRLAERRTRCGLRGHSVSSPDGRACSRRSATARSSAGRSSG